MIQAYASTHGGNDPTPALVKQILMSTATDIDAPATEQGAGLLNVLAAVKEAKSIGSGSVAATTQPSGGGLLLTPDRSTWSRDPGEHLQPIRPGDQHGSDPVTVNLSTRALASTPIASTDRRRSACSPRADDVAVRANTGDVPDLERCQRGVSGRALHRPDDERSVAARVRGRLPGHRSGSLLHVALIEPNGAYAAYSIPQGVGDYGEVEVANPPPGKWTAVFFTEPALDDVGANVPVNKRDDPVERQHVHVRRGRQHHPVDADDRPGSDRLRAPRAHELERLG